MKQMKSLLLTLALLGAASCSPAQEPLRVMVIFAHPDEGEIYAGGVTALYSKLGHQVKFMSLTNGDAGHFSMKPEDLAARRHGEAMKAKEILGLSEYEILDHHDGVLRNEKGVREQVIRSIMDWNADIVFTFYPAKGGHNDNMTAGWIVREASMQLDPETLPVFVYMRDFHTVSFSYIPDIAIDIDEVWETKLAACGAHESQVVEYNPEAEGVLEEVLASGKKREEFLFHNTVPFSIIRPDNQLALEKWYGREHARNVTFAEEFEIAEFGRQISDREVHALFPMLGWSFTVPAKTGWFDTGIDVKQGQGLDIHCTGKILWNLEEGKYCGPEGENPYTRQGERPLTGVGAGALIGKIGERSSAYFAVGKQQEITSGESGRLYLGINEENTGDNEGVFRVRVRAD